MKASALIDSYRDKSTLDLWVKANFGAYRNLPKTPKGKEKYRHVVGETVVATGVGGLRRGVEFVIGSKGTTHGFVHYYGAGMWHRSQDVQAITKPANA